MLFWRNDMLTVALFLLGAMLPIEVPDASGWFDL